MMRAYVVRWEIVRFLSAGWRRPTFVQSPHWRLFNDANPTKMDAGKRERGYVFDRADFVRDDLDTYQGSLIFDLSRRAKAGTQMFSFVDLPRTTT